MTDNTETTIQNILNTVDELVITEINIEGEKTDREGLMDFMLGYFQDCETSDMSLDMVKLQVFDIRHWNYKVEDAATGAIRSVNFGKGAKAPNVVSVIFSQGKKYLEAGYAFSNAKCWEDVKNGGKSSDGLDKLRAVCKDYVKAHKAVSQGEIDYGVGALETLITALQDRLDAS